MNSTDRDVRKQDSSRPSTDSPLPVPYRGPTPKQSRNQYFDVLNHFFADGVRVRRYARFKRIGDKEGWGQPEWKEGLEVDRDTLIYRLDIPQPGARLAELSADGCEIVSYQKPDPPHGMVTYILVSWPSDSELERNRSARIARKTPEQEKFPRSMTAFQPPQMEFEFTP